MCCNLLCFKDSIIRKEILKILISARRNSKHIRRGHLQGVQAQTVCFSFYALFPPPTFYFAFLKRSLKVLQEAMSALQVIFSLPLNFNAHYPKLHLILLSLFALMAFLCNPGSSHMNTLNATSSCSHLEALTVPGACSLGLILTLVLFLALCFSPLYLSPHIFWPHLLLVPAGSSGIWKWNSSMARLVPVRHRHNGCSETQWIIRLTLRELIPSSATRKAQKCLVNSL